MKVHIKAAGDVRIVEVVGRLVHGETDPLRDAVKSLLADGHKAIVIDLTAVPFMDSSGLGELAACRKRFLEGGANARIIARSGHFNLIIETTIQSLFPGMVVERELEAVGSL